MARNDDSFSITDEDLLPDGGSLDPDVDGEEGFNIANLHVNFSQQEADSEAKDFSPVPTAKYHVAITEVKPQQCGPNSKNTGKWFYNVQVTIQDGPHENRKCFGNVMLFDGALYSLAQINKAQGWPMKVPAPEDLLGTHYMCQINKQLDTYKINKSKEDGSFDPAEPKPYKNEIKNWGKYDGSVSVHGASSGGDTLMP
jgi:hypothetical protein